MNDEQLQGELNDLRSQIAALNDRLRRLEGEVDASPTGFLADAPKSRAEKMRYENASEIYEMGHS